MCVTLSRLLNPGLASFLIFINFATYFQRVIAISIEKLQNWLLVKITLALVGTICQHSVILEMSVLVIF